MRKKDKIKIHDLFWDGHLRLDKVITGIQDWILDLPRLKTKEEIRNELNKFILALQEIEEMLSEGWGLLKSELDWPRKKKEDREKYGEFHWPDSFRER